MAVRPEILAQLARMLGDSALRSATDDQVQASVDAHFDRLVDALVAETAASDDVHDRESAEAYLGSRLGSLASVLSARTIASLRPAVHERIASW